MHKFLLKKLRKPKQPTVSVGCQPIKPTLYVKVDSNLILDMIEINKDLSAIPTAFLLLLHYDPALKLRAAQKNSIAQIGHSFLSKWQFRYNRSFTTPSKTQIEGIQEALRKYGPAIPKSARQFIEFNLKAFL